jgi:hypothetical protein
LLYPSFDKFCLCPFTLNPPAVVNAAPVKAVPDLKLSFFP